MINGISEYVNKLINNYRDACLKSNRNLQVTTREALERYIVRYKRALEGLTPGGSEFVDDPERCAQFVQDRRSLNDRVAQVVLEKDIKALVESVLSIAEGFIPNAVDWETIRCKAIRMKDTYKGEKQNATEQVNS